MISSNRMKQKPDEMVYELTGQLVDGRIRDCEWSELQSLLINSEEGRRAYVNAMLLEAGLYSLFNQFEKELLS